MGDYHKEHGRWTLTYPRSGETVEVHATLFSLELIEPNGMKSGPWPRMGFRHLF